MAGMTMTAPAVRVGVLHKNSVRGNAVRTAVPRAAARRSMRVLAVSAPDAPPSISERGDWSPSSWNQYEAKQQPKWPSEDELKDVLAEIERYPPLVFAGEARNLREKLAQVAMGNGFVLQGGDCAESFAEFKADNIRDTFRVILQMSAVLMFGSGVPVVKIGRMAGQFAKPRSEDLETIKGVSLPSYRGDNINGDAFTSEARIPNPQRLIRAYNQSAATLNLLRGFAMGGYAALERVTQWNLDFMQESEQGNKYKQMAQQLDEALVFMVRPRSGEVTGASQPVSKMGRDLARIPDVLASDVFALSQRACGINEDHQLMKSTDFYTSHEALLLHYEQALTRKDSTTGNYYGCSAHLLWMGERTRQLDCAHIEYMRGIHNPIGIKISDKCDPDELIELIETVNPTNQPGKIMIIVRMGAEKLREKLPKLIAAVENAGKIVVWQSDPMHGNTIKSESGYKTRPFERIRDELRVFFDVHEQMGTHAGGVHLEMTGQNVTECTGGSNTVMDSDLPSRYHTHCDPRLNASQALELSFLIAQRLRKQRMARESGSFKL